MKDLFTDLPAMLKKELQEQLKVKRIPRTYGGRKKPQGKSSQYTYPATPPIASGNLYNNIDAFWDTNPAGEPVMIVEMPDYWLWVNDGRRPGRYPPMGAIDRWSVQKGLSGVRDEKGRFIPRKTLNFLRARSIAMYGYKGTNFVDKAIQKLLQNVETEFGDAAKQYVEDILNEQIKLYTQGIAINVQL
jgi:hypothetical protein